jgi:hypothetical protein
MASTQKPPAAEQAPPVAPAPEPVAVPAEPEASPEVQRRFRSHVARIREEFGRYKAARLLYLDGVPAVAEGGAIPQSHPHLQEWIDEGGVIDLQAKSAP